MKSNFTFENKGSYLYCTISGEYDPPEFRSYAKIVADECKKKKIYKVLVNALNVKETNLPIFDRYFVGEKIAELLPKIKIAVAWPENDINKFAETVAVNRGGFIYVVGDIESAEKWLMTKI